MAFLLLERRLFLLLSLLIGVSKEADMDSALVFNEATLCLEGTMLSFVVVVVVAWAKPDMCGDMRSIG